MRNCFLVVACSSLTLFCTLYLHPAPRVPANCSQSQRLGTPSPGARYKVTAGNVDSDGFPTSPAKICVETTSQCYNAPKHIPAFGLNQKMRSLDAPKGRTLVAFTAEASAGGSGTLTYVALIEERSDRLTNLLPFVAVTNQSEYAFWSVPLDPMPVLVTADFVWFD